MEYLRKLLGQKDPNAAEEFFTNQDRPVMLPPEEETNEIPMQRPAKTEEELYQDMADTVEGERMMFDSQPPQPEKSPVVAEPPKSRDQMLLEEIQKLRKGSDDELKSARNLDILSSAFNAISPMLENRRRAKAMQSAQSIGADPGSLNMPKFATDSASKALAERQAKINELLQEQKLMAALQPKTMSKLDQAKIKESEAKAKMYESRSGQSIDQKELIKEETKIRSENRQEKKQLERDAQNTEKLLKDLEDTKKLFESYSKGSVGGTGPLATGFGSKKVFSADLERLDSKFKQQNLETMSKMFQGMSKAVDSDAERRAFESAQPAITNDDSTNQQIIEDRIKAAKELLNKQRAKASSIDSKGNAIEQDNQVDPTIEQYAKQNNINYKKAEQILKSRGYNAK